MLSDTKLIDYAKKYYKLTKKIKELENEKKEIRSLFKNELKSRDTHKLILEDETIGITISSIRQTDIIGTDEEKFCQILINALNEFVDTWFKEIGKYLKKKGIVVEIPKPKPDVIDDIVFDARDKSQIVKRKGSQRIDIRVEPKL